MKRTSTATTCRRAKPQTPVVITVLRATANRRLRLYSCPQVELIKTGSVTELEHELQVNQLSALAGVVVELHERQTARAALKKHGVSVPIVLAVSGTSEIHAAVRTIKQRSRVCQCVDFVNILGRNPAISFSEAVRTLLKVPIISQAEARAGLATLETRELRLLRKVASGLAKSEISDSLYQSTSAQIVKKLGVFSFCSVMRTWRIAYARR